jgi:hypothetical protein
VSQVDASMPCYPPRCWWYPRRWVSCTRPQPAVPFERLTAAGRDAAGPHTQDPAVLAPHDTAVGQVHQSPASQVDQARHHLLERIPGPHGLEERNTSLILYLRPGGSSAALCGALHSPPQFHGSTVSSPQRPLRFPHAAVAPARRGRAGTQVDPSAFVTPFSVGRPTWAARSVSKRFRLRERASSASAPCCTRQAPLVGRTSRRCWIH